MNEIITILKGFSREQFQEFQTFLKNKNRRGDVKNIILLKFIQKGEIKKLDEKLYGKPNKNALHALSKRLLDNLVEFIAVSSFSNESSEEMEVLKLLLASRIFLEQGNYKLGFKSLLKSEKIAIENDLFAILNEIYHTKIQYAHQHPKQSLDSILREASQNLEFLKKEQKINAAYATIKYKLKTLDYASINQITEETLNEFDISIYTSFTYKSLFQFMKLLSTTATLKRDYYSFSPLLLKIYEVVNQKSVSEEKHLFYHIEILYIMAINYFRNKDFDNSLFFINEMEKKILLQKGKYKIQFKEKLILIKSLHHLYTGNPQEASKLLLSPSKKSLDVLLTLAMLHFQQNRFKEAYKIIIQFSHTNNWYENQIGLLWTLKKNIIELLLLIELDKMDLFLLSLNKFKKRYRKKLTKLNEDRVLPFVELAAEYYENPKIVTKDNFKEKVENTFTWKEAKAEDIFVMSFYAWLKSKMEKTPLYQTTLDLVKR